jgi:two-component system cell cycle sensor histidine kinase/response regulator CckA
MKSEECVRNTYFEDGEPKRWMLVDDNEDILLVISALVEKLTGARTECHNSPESALAAFTAAPEAYELVITDYEMPGMTGIELCRRLRLLAPEQKVILATGSGYFTKEAARIAGFCAFLRKPFPLTALKAALAEAGMGRRMSQEILNA